MGDMERSASPKADPAPEPEKPPDLQASAFAKFFKRVGADPVSLTKQQELDLQKAKEQEARDEAEARRRSAEDRDRAIAEEAQRKKAELLASQPPTTPTAAPTASPSRQGRSEAHTEGERTSRSASRNHDGEDDEKAADRQSGKGEVETLKLGLPKPGTVTK